MTLGNKNKNKPINWKPNTYKRYKYCERTQHADWGFMQTGMATCKRSSM